MISPERAPLIPYDFFVTSSDSTPDAVLDLTNSTVFSVVNPFLLLDEIDEVRSPFSQQHVGFGSVIDLTGEDSDEDVDQEHQSREVRVPESEEQRGQNVQEAVDDAPVLPPGLLSIGFKGVCPLVGRPENEEPNTDYRKYEFEQLMECAARHEPGEE